MGEKKLTIAHLARKLRVHRNSLTLLYYEKAKKIDLNLLTKLCKYFDCTISDLIEYQPKAKRKSKDTQHLSN